MKRIGIAGAENSHTVAIAKEINVNKRVPGFFLEYVWGETDELAKQAAEQGGIPTIVSDPKEMLGKIDAVICDLNSEYGGVFFYGIHQVDMALNAFGYDVKRAFVLKNVEGFAVGQVLEALQRSIDSGAIETV